MGNIAEWRDIRITGQYYPIGSAVLRKVDRQFRLAGSTDQYGATTGLTATALKQDVTPTYTQAQAGEAGFNVVSPVASDAFASATGTHGLEESSDQPGDLTRLFYGTVDGSRAHHMAAQRYGPYGGVNGPGAVSFASGGLAGANLILAMTEIGNSAGTGIVVFEQAGTYGYYTFSRANGQWTRVGAAWNPQQPPFNIAGAGTPTIRMASMPLFRQLGTKVWLPVNGVAQLKDLIGGGTVATDNAVRGYFVLGDRLHTYAYATGNSVELNPFDIASDGSLTRTQNSLPANVVGNIKDPGNPIGVCVSNGFAMLVTDRGLYSISFDDVNKKYNTSLVDDIPLGATGKPVTWGGDVWVPCGNRIYRFTVGKPGFTWMPIDPQGTLPSPFDSDIVQLIPTHDRLVIRMAKDATRAALLTLDGGGAVAVLKWSDNLDNATTGTAELYTHPAIPVLSYGEPLVLVPRSVLGGGNTTIMDSYVVPNGTRNPRKFVAAQRQQLAQGVALWPFQYGVNRLAKKTPVRIGAEVNDVGTSAAGLTVKYYIQRDSESETTAQTFGSGPLSGTGTWHFVNEVAITSFGIDPNTGSGVLWTELTDVGGEYTICNTRYRVCAIIGGDASGVKYPELRSLIVERYEWVNKGYLSQYRIRLQMWDQAADDMDAAKFGTYEDESELAAAIADLIALNDHEVIATFWPPAGSDADAFRGVITKFNMDPQNKSMDGLTHAMVTLSVTHVVPAGRYADTLL